MFVGNESDRFMVVLFPMESVRRIPLRVAAFEEALAYSRSFNRHASQTKTCAVILPDVLAEPPIFRRVPGQDSLPEL